MGDKRLYLIDATAFCYRAFYALPSLSTTFGQPTGAVYGFVNMLNKILKSEKPEFLAVCFDVSRDTFRQKKFAAYKLKRPPMPESLINQMPLIKELVSAYGITILERQGYEADDIIATSTRRAKEQGLAVTIISSDKDILQLVDDNTVIFSPYKDEGIIYDTQKVHQRFGVSPKQIVDIIALMGDDVDNIPGVPGIGEKTAVELIKQFGSLKRLLNNIDKLEQEKIKKAIRDNIARINLNQELASLEQDIDLDFDLARLKLGKRNLQELFRLFRYLEFKTLLKELPMPEEKNQGIKVQLWQDNQLKNLIANNAELFLFGEGLSNLVFCYQAQFFRLDEPGANLRTLLASPKIKKISHDLKKIKRALTKNDVILSGLHFDTLVAGYLLNPSLGKYNLTDLAFDYLGKIPQAKTLDNQQALGLIVELKTRLEKELHDKSLFRLFTDIEMPLIEVLVDMEGVGIKLDLEVLKELSQDIEKKLIKLIEDIHQQSGAQFNLNSPKQLRDILFNKLKLPILKKTKTGPSTDEEVLRNLSTQHNLPTLLLEYRQLMKLKTTYIDTLPELVVLKTGKIHTSFNQTATETGRLSSSDPNLQNIPIKTELGKNIRRAIVAESRENCLLAGDYSQIELRILAHLSKDKELMLAFKQDRDIHKATASLIYGLEGNDITDSMREVAKRVNFGIIYGLSAYGLSRDLGISIEQAQNFIDAYFLRYAQVKVYIQEQIRQAQKDGFVTTILGRRRYIPQIDNKNQAIRQFAERQAVNTPIQGSASDLIKLAMIQLYEQIKMEKLKAKMILQIHDELLFDVHRQELKELAKLVREIMENAIKLDVPVKVDIKLGKNWLEMETVK